MRKRDQTIEWALEQMNKPRNFLSIKDIAQRLWTDELIITALSNFNASLNTIPEAKRTLPVCMAAIDHSDFNYMLSDSLYFVPQKFINIDFLCHAVSVTPRHFGAAWYLQRKGRETAAYSEEDYRLVKEALYPTICVQRRMEEQKIEVPDDLTDEMERKKFLLSKLHIPLPQPLPSLMILEAFHALDLLQGKEDADVKTDPEVIL